jgi:predicted ester cyclase
MDYGRVEIVDTAVDGDSVVVRCRVSGTHRGVGARAINGGFLKGVQPTGKRFEVQHIHWYKVRDGKITDHAASRDDLGMTQQLGLLPKAPM